MKLMKKDNSDLEDTLRSEYDLKQLRVRRLGPGRKSFAPSTEVYRYVLKFVASQPTPEQVAGFRPTAQMQERIEQLLAKEKEKNLSVDERLELDEYERIEHFIIMLKINNGEGLTSA